MAKKYENVEKITSLLEEEKLGGVQKRLLSTEKSLSGILKKLATLETEKQEREVAEAAAKAEAEASAKAAEEAAHIAAEEKAKAEAEKKAEEERLAEIERLKKEKEEAQRDYFLKQQELLTQIRDALNNK